MSENGEEIGIVEEEKSEVDPEDREEKTEDPELRIVPGEVHSVQDELEEDWVQRTGIKIRIINVVGTVDLQTRLDLKTIALHARNAEYNPKRFSAVIMRMREPKTTGLIFSTGKVVITGAKTDIACRLAARKFARIVQKLNFPARFTNFKLQNVVGTCDVRFPIRLEGLVNDHSRFSSYEPELFPGLIYKLVEPKLCLLIFVSGKIVLTGAKSVRQLYEALDKMYPVLVEYRKQALAPSIGSVGFEQEADMEQDSNAIV